MKHLGLASVLLFAGCQEPERMPVFTPMRQAVGIVEANRHRVRTGLKATGTARGYFKDNRGNRRHLDLGAKLQVVPPTHMRFVLQDALGQDQLEVGMNDAKWWLLVRQPEERYFEGPMGTEPDVSITGTVPLKAEQLMESLGLNPLGGAHAGQRVVDDHQQLIFMTKGEDGRAAIEKEYWLDRYPPLLIGRIVFRDDEGRMTLESHLGRYRPVADGGPQLPHELRLVWPSEEAELAFHIRNWDELERLTVDHRAFVSPRDRGGRFDDEMITPTD